MSFGWIMLLHIYELFLYVYIGVFIAQNSTSPTILIKEALDAGRVDIKTPVTHFSYFYLIPDYLINEYDLSGDFKYFPALLVLVCCEFCLYR